MLIKKKYVEYKLTRLDLKPGNKFRVRNNRKDEIFTVSSGEMIQEVISTKRTLLTILAVPIQEPVGRFPLFVKYKYPEGVGFTTDIFDNTSDILVE